MGIIARQSIKQSLVTYLGIGIGAINILFIYPTALTKAEYGFIFFFITCCKLLLPFVLLGSLYLIVRYFPFFQDEKKGHNGYLFFLFLLPFVGSLLFALAYCLFEPLIINEFDKNADFLSSLGKYMIPVMLFFALSTTLTRYISNFHRITIPAIFNDLFTKIGVPILCLLYYWKVFSLEGLMQGYVLLHVLIFLALLWYCRYLGQLFLKPDFKYLNKEKVKEMGIFALYGLLGGLGSAIVPYIDTIMVTGMLGYVSTAIYTIPNFISSAIDAPRRAISNISAPIVSTAWKDNNLKEIKQLYQKTSLNQFIVGLLFLSLVWLSIDDLYTLIPEDNSSKEQYKAGKYIVLILGASKVLDMLTGINSEIIGYSKYYRFNFVAILLLTFFTILTNWLFIPIWDIEGAAFATFLSFLIFNLAKFLFLKIRLNIQPFTRNTLWVFLVGLVSYGAASLLPTTDWAILNILIKSIVGGGVFGGLILYLNISEDFSGLVRKVWKRPEL